MILLVLHAPPPILNVDDPQVYLPGRTPHANARKAVRGFLESGECLPASGAVVQVQAQRLRQAPGLISFPERQRLPRAARSSRLRSRRAGCAAGPAGAPPP